MECTAIQGIGGGAIINLAEIICSDLVPLAERGVYQGMIGLTWALACGVGPPLVSTPCLLEVMESIIMRCREVSSLAKPRGAGCSVRAAPSAAYAHAHALADLNLPLSGIALVLVWFFLRVRTPPGSMRSKLAQIDWTCVACIPIQPLPLTLA